MGARQLLVVLGGGESGVGAAVLGVKKGYEVLLSDSGELKQNYKDVLLNNKVELEEGGHSEGRILSADLVVKSPGIPDTATLIVKLKEKGIEVISEIEFASRYTNATLIGITGSNGKTTTTSLIHHLLKSAGLNVGLAGNIGKSFAMQVAQNDFDTYVLELSSFQLDGIVEARFDVAVLLNITPDHLDRYDYDLQKYVDSKFKILNKANTNSFFVCSADDAIVNANYASKNYKGRVKKFSVDKQVAAFFEDGKLVSDKGFKMGVNDLEIKGKHNYANALAAILVAEEMGLSQPQMARGLASFTTIEHRLEKVRDVEGVEYINDSKATNVDAVYYALDAMTKPVVWVVGGVDKGNDYNLIMPLVKEKVKAIVCLGKDNSKLKTAFEQVVEGFEEATSAQEAVEKATRLAMKGDVVLLSPACASFDLFKSYEDRGKQFKQTINNL